MMFISVTTYNYTNSKSGYLQWVTAFTVNFFIVQLIKYGTVNVKSLKIKVKKAKILCLSYCKF